MKNLQNFETENLAQAVVIDYCSYKGIEVIHIPNERKASKWQHFHLKKQGLRKGFPDLLLFKNKKILFIEMKRKKGGIVSKDQNLQIQILKNNGFQANICNGSTEAINLINNFFNIKN